MKWAALVLSTTVLAAAQNFNDSEVNLTLIGGDPITFSPDGEKIKFWLEEGRHHELLRTPDVVFKAKVFPGPSIEYQWFDEFLIFTESNQQILSVTLKRNTSEPVVENGFQQMDVRVAMKGQMQLLETLPADTQQTFFAVDTPMGKIKVQVGRRHHTYYDMEFVHIESDTIAAVIETRLAGTEFPNDVEKAIEYKHLDMFVLEQNKGSSFTGILPELWGQQPRSAAVQAMLTDPREKMSSEVCTEPGSVNM